MLRVGVLLGAVALMEKFPWNPIFLLQESSLAFFSGFPLALDKQGDDGAKNCETIIENESGTFPTIKERGMRRTLETWLCLNRWNRLSGALSTCSHPLVTYFHWSSLSDFQESHIQMFQSRKFNRGKMQTTTTLVIALLSQLNVGSAWLHIVYVGRRA